MQTFRHQRAIEKRRSIKEVKKAGPNKTWQKIGYLNKEINFAREEQPLLLKKESARLPIKTT